MVISHFLCFFAKPKDSIKNYSMMQITPISFQVVLLKPHVFNPALPYIIVLSLLLVVSIIFIGMYYRKIHLKRREKFFARQSTLKFRNDLVFNYSANYKWTIQGQTIKFFGNIYILDEFTKFIKESEQQILFQRFISNRATALGQKFRVQICTDDSGIYNWWEFSCLRQDDNQLQGLVVNCDQQKEEEEQLLNTKLAKDSVILKETVLANMNHDIRSPLSAVAGYAELLSHDDLNISEEEQRDYARIIKTNASLLLKLLDDAVSTKNSELGLFKFNLVDAKVDELFKETYETNHILVPSNLKFNLQKGAPNLVLKMDKARIKQVLNNFLSNAIKFTEMGSITLGWDVWDDTDEVELFVEDTGKGISQVEQAKIFDRFFTTDVDHKGLGLGLNICRAIVEQHNGRIAVKSQLGKGSRFSAFIKLEKGGKE